MYVGHISYVQSRVALAAIATGAHGYWMKYHALISVWITGVTCLSCCNTLTAEAAKETLIGSGIQINPPVVLVFDYPTDGSVVQGTHAELKFTLRSSRSGPALTHEEVKILREDGTSICFAVQKVFAEESTLCVGLTTDILSVDGLLPGAWHTITATLHSTAVPGAGESEANRALEAVAAKWDHAGDNVTLMVAMEGSTTMCGDSVCLDSSDLRATYFDNVYR